jgi:hypothetical protein
MQGRLPRLIARRMYLFSKTGFLLSVSVWSGVRIFNIQNMFFNIKNENIQGGGGGLGMQYMSERASSQDHQIKAPVRSKL